MASCDSDDRRVRISYDIKHLQRIEDDADYVVTLNDSASIDPSAVLATMTYAHPTYTRGSVAAQRELPMLNHDRTAFAGAWHGLGLPRGRLRRPGVRGGASRSAPGGSAS